MKTCVKVTFLLLFMSFFAASSLHAVKSAYVTDQIEIQLRSGPGSGHKLIGTLTSGTPIDVKKEESGWVLVVPISGAFKDKEGWVPKRHLVDNPPKSQDMVQLSEENKELKNSIGKYEAEIGALKNEITSLKNELELSNNKYRTLQEESAEYLNLKSEHATLQQDVEKLKAEKKNLLEESQKARNSERMKWFLAGAGVLFCGWLIGVSMGKMQRRKSYISYWR